MLIQCIWHIITSSTKFSYWRWLSLIYIEMDFVTHCLFLKRKLHLWTACAWCVRKHLLPNVGWSTIRMQLPSTFSHSTHDECGSGMICRPQPETSIRNCVYTIQISSRDTMRQWQNLLLYLQTGPGSKDSSDWNLAWCMKKYRDINKISVCHKGGLFCTKQITCIKSPSFSS